MTAITMTFAAPRLLLIEAGAVRRIAEVLGKFGLSRPLVVTDPFMVSSGHLRHCLDPLAAAGLVVSVFSDTVPDPTDTVIEAGVALLRQGDHDCLIGFGGGSPIDTAKAMAILAAGGGDVGRPDLREVALAAERHRPERQRRHAQPARAQLAVVHLAQPSPTTACGTVPRAWIRTRIGPGTPVESSTSHQDRHEENQGHG